MMYKASWMEGFNWSEFCSVMTPYSTVMSHSSTEPRVLHLIPHRYICSLSRICFPIAQQASAVIHLCYLIPIRTNTNISNTSSSIILLLYLHVIPLHLPIFDS